MPTKDALFVAAHVWALDTSIPLTIVAGARPNVRATAPFAIPAALVAMKLHAIEDRSETRGLEKRAGDAWTSTGFSWTSTATARSDKSWLARLSCCEDSSRMRQSGSS